MNFFLTATNFNQKNRCLFPVRGSETTHGLVPVEMALSLSLQPLATLCFQLNYILSSQIKIKSSNYASYLQYYTQVCNEFWDPSPSLCACRLHSSFRRNASAVASHWQLCARLMKLSISKHRIVEA